MRLIVVLGVLVVSAMRAAAAAPEAPKDFQPWNGAALTDWENAKKAIVITDMTAAEPSTVFSPTPKKGHWMTIPYEMRPDSGAPTRRPKINYLGVRVPEHDGEMANPKVWVSRET